MHALLTLVNPSLTGIDYLFRADRCSNLAVSIFKKQKIKIMKKYILPLFALMIISAASNAQTSTKKTPAKTVTTKPAGTTKANSTQSVTPSKTKTTASANTVATHKKRHHKKPKKTGKK
jgi:hypothetical protein